MEIERTIQILIDQDLDSMESHLQEWVKEYRIQPSIVSMLTQLEGKNTKDLWILTAEEGASSQITFDPETKEFGLGMVLENGNYWYMGQYGSFKETVENM